MAQRLVLVKVGEGLWSRVQTDLSKEDRMSLLEMLAGTRAFAVKLRDVALDDCAVCVCASASNKAPSTDEEASARQLEGGDSLGDLAADLAGNLFIHVQLPASRAAAAAAAGGESVHNWDAGAAQHARRPSGLPASGLLSLRHCPMQTGFAAYTHPARTPP